MCVRARASVCAFASFGVCTCVQESCFICKGVEGSNAVMRMNGAAQDEVWLSIEKCDYAAYRSCLSSTVRVVPTERQGNAANIPVRIYVRRSGEGAPGRQGG